MDLNGNFVYNKASKYYLQFKSQNSFLSTINKYINYNNRNFLSVKCEINFYTQYFINKNLFNFDCFGIKQKKNYMTHSFLILSISKSSYI